MARPGLSAAVVWLLGLAAVGGQALALATRYFQPGLNADFIYPQLFAEDVLAGQYPLAGWTLSSAPYFFPDMLAALALRIAGGGGTVLPAYVVFAYLLLAVLAGWSLQRVTRTGWAAWLGGVALVNALLLWQAVPGHAAALWLLGSVGFHGGVVLLGLATVALWAQPEGESMSRRRQSVALAVMSLGLGSDTLFLTQAALPLAVGLWAQAGWNRRHPHVRTYGLTLLGALGVAGLVRALFWGSGYFQISTVVRYVPTPPAISQAVARFFRDVGGRLAPEGWGFLGLALLALGVVIGLAWRAGRRNEALPSEGRLSLGFGLAGLLATTLLPLATAYWKDATHLRYLLPWLVWPGWLGLAWALPKISAGLNHPRCPPVLGAVWLAILVLTWPQIQPAQLRWPYTEQQAQLDDFLGRAGLHHGLSDYWHAHLINTVSHRPVRLFPLRPTARVSFWNNNAYWFYEGDPPTGQLRVPEYQFIIVDGLDPAALRDRFGEPAKEERVGGLTVWLYGAVERERLTRAVQAEVREFLRGRPGEDKIAQTTPPSR